jgi:nucleoside-diphosphate-sugar epimerase
MILCIGGAGYIGSLLVPALENRGYKVVVTDLLWFGNHLPKDIGIKKQDASSLTIQDLEPFDTVIFLAGLSNDPMAEFSPVRNFIENAGIPSYIAYICRKAGVKRLIYAGSTSVYGHVTGGPCSENAPKRADYPYGIAKLQGESGCLQMATKEMSVISLRKGTVGGYSKRMRLDLVVNAMFKHAVQDSLITVSNPAIWRPTLDIRDAVSAYIRAIEAPQNISGAFNITSANHTLGEIADLIRIGVESHTGNKIRIKANNVQDFRNYRLNPIKARRDLSFSAKFDVDNTVDYLYENLDKFRDFDNDNYYNIRIFRNTQI